MFTSLAYFFGFIAACSCQTNTPTDPSKPADVSGIFYRYYPKQVTDYVDIPLSSGVNLLTEPNYNKDARTIFYVEAWEQNANTPAAQAIVQAYLTNNVTNQVVCDWSNINTNADYAAVAAEVEEVGTAFGKQLCELIKAGIDPGKIELVGFSTGAHVAGQAGYTVQESCNKTIHRIVALDAALELFYLPVPLYRPIDKDDAEQTIAIHTSGGQLGALQRTAKVDFYVNKGTPYQPGCDITSTFSSCNHIRAWQVFNESIWQTEAFRAAPADSYVEFSLQSCEDNEEEEKVVMGDKTGQSVRGKFYLTTSGESPYGRGVDGLCV